jgi:hypothetical protein
MSSLENEDDTKPSAIKKMKQRDVESESSTAGVSADADAAAFRLVLVLLVLRQQQSTASFIDLPYILHLPAFPYWSQLAPMPIESLRRSSSPRNSSTYGPSFPMKRLMPRRFRKFQLVSHIQSGQCPSRFQKVKPKKSCWTRSWREEQD